MDFGKMHLLVLHFPIALIVAAAVADLLALITRRPFFKSAGLYCLIGALLSGPVAVATGWDLLGDLKPAGDLSRLQLVDLAWWLKLGGGTEPPSTLTTLATAAAWHRAFGIATVALVIVAVAARLLMLKSAAKWLAVVYALLVLAMVAAVSVTGHLGGVLTFVSRDYLAGLP